MTPRRFAPFLLLTLAAFLAARADKPEADPGAAAGHWEGSIELAEIALELRVDLDVESRVWTGTIDIPAQGVRGFTLAQIGVDGRTVSFRMAGVPGDPRFAGELADEGRSIAGTFTQGGRSFPFHLVRAVKAPDPLATPETGVPGTGFAGAWQGSFRPGPVELRLVLDLKSGPDGLTGDVDSIDQKAMDLPITAARVDGKSVHLELSTIASVFDGTLSEDGSRIDGTWKQGGRSTPIVFKRLEAAPDLGRPQDPKKPYPYRAESIRFPSAATGIELAGTLTLPEEPGPHPAVVLITGSGPQDRDETVAGHRPFLVLADRLTRAGIVVLRYDDRGVGESGGDFRTARNADFVEDALGAVAFLKTRPEANRARIGLLGHSEGGVVAPRAAVRSDDVAFLVLMAAVAVPLDELLTRQVSDLLRVAGADPETIAAESAKEREILKVSREVGDTPEGRDRLAATLRAASPDRSKETIDAQLSTLTGPWFRELLAYDPRPTLERVRCPVLALNGDKDVQVAADENLAAIERALKNGGNPDVTVRRLPGLNHLFQTADTGAIAEYARIDETIAPAVLDLIATWIVERAASPRDPTGPRPP